MSQSPDRARGALATVGVVALATGLSWAIGGRERLADAVMLYLLGVVAVSMRFGTGVSLVAAVLGVLSFNFFFIPPYYTFAVADVRHLVTFGVMLFVAAVVSGLTERRRRLADEAEAARVEAETERLRSALLSAVSHDLRTPLAVVTGAASTLLDERLDASTRRELTESIVDEAERLNRLVQNLLDMTRLEGGAMHVTKTWQPLEEVIGSALTRADKLLGARAVTTDLPKDIALVPVDPVLLEQVLINLFDNAVKYAPSGSPIEVRAALEPTEVRVEVADRGPGVPEAEREKIFEKFYRASTRDGGAGIGLAVCRGIVQAHGGRIWVEPREGGGTRFCFTIPLDGPPRLAGVEEEESPAEASG